MNRARQVASTWNPNYVASQGPAQGGKIWCKLFPNAAACQEIAAPCPAGHEPCGTTISGGQRCCPSGAPAPGPTRTFTLPSGKRGRVRAHRSYRSPRGKVTFNPNMATVTTRYVKKWVPAYDGRAAIGSRGAWVRLPQDGSNIGTLHTPGLAARRVVIGGVRDGHALIRHRADANPVRSSSTVSTRRRRRRRSTVRVKAPGTTTAKFDWCRWFPNSNKCQQDIAAACPAGTEWNGYHCAPSGNPGRSRRTATVKANPAVSASAHRHQSVNASGMDRLGKALRDLGSGRARLVVDRSGISVRNPDFPGSCNRAA